MSKTKTKTKKTRSNDEHDKVLEEFARGIALLYDRKWEGAQKVFASLAKSQPSSPLAERSRRYLEVCAAKSLSDRKNSDDTGRTR